MKLIGVIVKVFIALAFLALLLGIFYQQGISFLRVPCEEPVSYVVGDIDPRFGIAKDALVADVEKAAALWNSAAGKPLVINKNTEGAVVVSLVYSPFQARAELGKNISKEQEAYNAKKDAVERIRLEFLALEASIEKKRAAFDTDAQTYQEEVAYFNEQGGAPPAEYKKLESKRISLEKQQAVLNGNIEKLNSMGNVLNEYVEELNILADAINAKTGEYNETAGTDFDQGFYKEEAGEKTITIYEFKDRDELRRVLAHEFGHAIGLEHVESPESLMYFYNIGKDLVLSEEDTKELARVCEW